MMRSTHHYVPKGQEFHHIDWSLDYRNLHWKRPFINNRSTKRDGVRSSQTFWWPWKQPWACINQICKHLSRLFHNRPPLEHGCEPYGIKQICDLAQQTLPALSAFAHFLVYDVDQLLLCYILCGMFQECIHGH